MATCRDCAHYDFEAFRIKSGVLRFGNGKMSRCLFNMARIERKFPASVAARDRVITPGWMSPNDGTGCPQWTQRAAIARATTQGD